MKKKLIKIFMIIIMANILVLNSQSFATQEMIKVSKNDATLNTILNLTDNQIKNLSYEQLDIYINYLNNATQSEVGKRTQITEKMRQLQVEKANRQINNNNPNEIINYIINMYDSDLKGLTDREIDTYISQLNGIDKSKVDMSKYATALRRLNNEKSRRNSDSGIDYKNYIPGQTGGSIKVEIMAGKVLGLIRNIGIAVSIIALSVIGVKYMVGSVEEKAGYKKSMIPFVIGVIFLAAGTTIVKFIYDFVMSSGL